MWVLYMKWSSLFLAMRSILSKRKNALSFFTRWTRKEPSRTSSPKPLRSGPVQFSNKLSISYNYHYYFFVHFTFTVSIELNTLKSHIYRIFDIVKSYREHLMSGITWSLTACSCFLFMSLMYQATAVIVIMASSTTSYPGSLLSKCLDSSYHKGVTTYQLNSLAGVIHFFLKGQGLVGWHGPICPAGRCQDQS